MYDLGLSQEQALRLKCLEMVDRDAMNRVAEAQSLFDYIIKGEAERRADQATSSNTPDA